MVQIAVIHDSIHLRFCESVATTKWYSATEQAKQVLFGLLDKHCSVALYPTVFIGYDIGNNIGKQICGSKLNLRFFDRASSRPFWSC